MVIVRTENAGVFAGNLESLDDVNRVAVLKNSRRIWYWSGAASLSQLATDGTSDPKNCKFPRAVETEKVFQVIEVIDCTETAEKSIREVPVWKK